ncbi:MAG: hypothetical protein WC209_06550 [Ignavibacteriaceae bacterium]
MVKCKGRSSGSGQMAVISRQLQLAVGNQQSAVSSGSICEID